MDVKEFLRSTNLLCSVLGIWFPTCSSGWMTLFCECWSWEFGKITLLATRSWNCVAFFHELCDTKAFHIINGTQSL